MDIAQRLISRTLNGKTDDDRKDQHQGHGDVQGQGRGQIDHHNTGYHEHITVGKVDEPQDTIYHGIADGNQCILTADGNAGQQVGKDDTHG